MGITENCWLLISEINQLELALKEFHPELNDQKSCEGLLCNYQLTHLPIPPKLPEIIEPSCSQETINKNLRECPQDLTCALVSTVTTIPGLKYNAEFLKRNLSSSNSEKTCGENDSCLQQISTAFLSSLFKFFNGAWSLLKSAGEYTSSKVSDFWTWVTSAEDSSSSAQLAMAKMSEDEGLFQMLKNDFSGTVLKIWQGLVSGIKKWLSDDIFCQKWSATPHHSQCMSPTKSINCLSCKSTLNGVCAIGGVFISEILPAFLTGGLITAAKHGANAASYFAKNTFKVSDAALKSIKSSGTLKSTIGIKSAQMTVGGTSALIGKVNRYLLSPARMKAKETFIALSDYLKKSKAYVAETSTGKYIVFAQDGLKIAGKIALYPIENNMTVLSYKLGQRTFDKAFKLAIPTIANKTSVAQAVTSKVPELEKILTRIEIEHIRKKDALSLELNQISILTSNRNDVLSHALRSKNPKFSELIRTIYPELNYGKLASRVTPESILKIEKDFYLTLEKISDTHLKKSLLAQYQSHIVNSPQRAKILPHSPSHKEIIDNSNLSALTRGTRALMIIGRVPKNSVQRKNLEHGVRAAINFSWEKKLEALMNSGFSEQESRKIMKYGFVGIPK